MLENELDRAFGLIHRVLIDHDIDETRAQELHCRRCQVVTDENKILRPSLSFDLLGDRVVALRDIVDAADVGVACEGRRNAICDRLAVVEAVNLDGDPAVGKIF